MKIYPNKKHRRKRKQVSMRQLYKIQATFTTTYNAVCVLYSCRIDTQQIECYVVKEMRRTSSYSLGELHYD